MSSTNTSFGTENQSPFQIESRREIISLLRGFKEQNQLISIMINGGSEIFISSILEVDDANNIVIFDSAPGDNANQLIVEASNVFFDGLLDRINIQFASSKLQRTTFEGRSALQMPIPANVIRLQRRENYRINTPVSNPVRVSIPLTLNENLEIIKFSLVDISCGGVAVLDDKKVLDINPNVIYSECQIDIPGIDIIDLTLEIRNSQDLILLNGKTNRRIGCAFIDLSSRTLATVQRYIMKLERERNAKITGLR